MNTCNYQYYNHWKNKYEYCNGTYRTESAEQLGTQSLNPQGSGPQPELDTESRYIKHTCDQCAISYLVIKPEYYNEL